MSEDTTENGEEQTEKLREPKLVEGEQIEKVEKLYADNRGSSADITPPPLTIVLETKEQKKFLHLGELDKAWQEVLAHSQENVANQRKTINSEVNKFWQEISKKYNLPENKNYRINPASGEITETPFPTPTKGAQQ